MNLLFIDTTTKDLVVAIVQQNGIRNFTHANCGTHHSTELCNCVQHALQSCNLTFNDLDAYSCSVGPGSFTGIRIGIATLKGYALATPKPFVVVNCLDAIAHSPACGNKLSAVIDAGNGYYFADYSNGDAAPILIPYDDPRQALAGRAASAADYLDGATALVRQRFANSQFVDEPIPLYIRRSQAEERK